MNIPATVTGSYKAPVGVSAEFAAGHAHGHALATTHAGAGTTGAAPYSLDAITKQARALAGQDTQSQIQTIQNQQQQILQQARDRADQINQAAAALAKMQAGVGDQTASSYRTAAQDEAGFANGYSGDLRNTASDAAAKVLANLTAVGGSADQIKNPEQGKQLGNVLYGLGGQMPANLLTTSGQAFAAAQRQLPGSTRGYGEQQAIGALGAGRQASDALIQQILDAKAGEPKLASSYASQLGTAAQNAALLPYLIDAKKNAAVPQGFTTDPATGQIIPLSSLTPPKPVSGKVVGSDKTGRNLVDPTTGKVISHLSDPVATTPKATKVRKLTPLQLQGSIAKANNGATALRYGVVDKKTGKPDPTHPPVSYTQALKEFEKEGYFASAQLARVAIKALDTAYGNGAAGGLGAIAGPPAPPSAP